MRDNPVVDGRVMISGEKLAQYVRWVREYFGSFDDYDRICKFYDTKAEGVIALEHIRPVFQIEEEDE